MKKQTAVEWLIEQFDITSDSPIIKNVVDKAKAMEKEQIMKAVDIGFDDGSNFIEDIKFTNAEQYYNETYNK